MITVFEFRIGNYYIQRYADGEVTECKLVTSQLLKDMDNQDEEVWCRRHWPEPISLNEAVLMAAGFKLREGYYHNFGFYVYKNFLRDGSGNWSGFNCIHSLLPLDSLHALQNVFYFLRGKELEINMEELKKAVG